jgi:hypothetical protein
MKQQQHRMQMVTALLEAATAITRGEDSGPILRLMVERLRAIPPVGAQVESSVEPSAPLPARRARPARAALATIPGLELEAEPASSMTISGTPGPVDGAIAIPMPAPSSDMVLPPARRDDREVVTEVFAYWARVTERPGSKLTSDRVTKIRARLREGYATEDLKAAIAGCAADPFYAGQNDRQTRYDTLEFILRNGSNVERFRDMAKGVSFEDTAKPKPTVTDDELEWDRETVRLDAVAKGYLKAKEMEKYAEQVRSNRERAAKRLK